ncbi:MAG: hypothetical protein RSC43_00135 [Clostridia bacterium]
MDTTQTKKIQAQIRSAVDNVYDIQKLRIASGNRLTQVFLQAMGIEPGHKKEEADEEVEGILKSVSAEYVGITKCFAEDFENKGKITKAIDKLGNHLNFITDDALYRLTNIYMNQVALESEAVKVVKYYVEQHPMWEEFFSKVKGCGPLMTGVCLGYFDPYKARHVSSFWKYAGLDVVYEEKEGKEGAYVGRAMRHTEMRDYVAKDGTTKEKRSLTYNPFVKTKLMGVLASGFIKCPGSTYDLVYRGYRHRLDNSPKYAEYTAGHKNTMALRYAVKQFLRDMWTTWRTLEGLEVTAPYEEAYLGRKPHGYNDGDKTQCFQAE